MYSKVSKYGPGAQRKIYHSKGKSCGYYMRIVFFFSSLIQSLIIVSLVLFLIYGKQQDSASVDRIQDLEKSFSRLSLENVELRQQRKNLTNLLNITTIHKTRFYWEVMKLHHMTNVSIFIIQESEKKLQSCNTEKRMCQFQLQDSSRPCSPTGQTISVGCNCGLEYERIRAKLEFVQSNFTQTLTVMKREMEQVAKERDNLNLEAIRLRREKTVHEKEMQYYRIKCKDEFIHTLSGVSNISKAFLQKIDSLFPFLAPFLLTCPKQEEYLQQIHRNCTSLSREVEDKFQSYLNNVGEQVSNIQGENSRLRAENERLSEDYRWCSQNRTNLKKEHKESLTKLQQKHDDEKESLLVDKLKLIGEQTVLENNIKFKIKEVEHLKEQVKYLNSSCMLKPGFSPLMPGVSPPRNPLQSGSPWNTFGGGANSRLGFGGTGSNFGSMGLGLNKQGSTGLGSSSFGSFGSTGSNPSLGLGSGLNKQGSTGLGSSSFGSSFGSTGLNPGLSSSGSGLNKLGSSGLGSSSFGSFGSAGSNPSLSSSGTGLNKAGTSGLGSSSFGSTGSNPSLSSSGTGLNRAGSSGLGSSSFGSTGSNPSLSSSGTGLNKAGSLGLGSSSFGSTGSKPSLSSSGSSLNKLGSSGLGSSSFGSSFGSTGSNPSLSSSGSGLNKAGSSGLGSSSFGSTGSNPSLSSSGSGLNKLGGTGTGSSSLGSSGSSLNKLGSNTNSRTSSFPGSSSSSSGSTGSSSSLGSSSSKTSTTNAKSSSSSSGSSSSSSSSGSSSSSSGSTKTGSGFSWLGFGSLSNSNTDQSKSGTGTGKGSSSGGSLGSGSIGSGRSTGRTVSVVQHLQDLQRIINPPGPEEAEREKETQDLYRLLG